MASVYKRRRLGAVPVGASVVSKPSGSRVATWIDGSGVQRRGEVVVAFDRRLGANIEKVVLHESDKYEIAYVDPHGRRHVVTGYTDRKASELLAERLERNAARLAEGLVDPFDEQMRRPIGDHLANYVSSVRQ